ncbi:MAG: D-alanyl-D-alanine carboxypeptidase family protein [Alphaproteobacteria bacterium]|nr:D-alanyl-D-alanine carboxypeptidase family protein [Alphaproteobacteria bacterium]MDP6816243.1 D-alanyl-D-alanine carboxypeptidase family protein [Alphaproteobacteria bacterium]
MRRFLVVLCLAVGLALSATGPRAAGALVETPAKQAMLIDHATGTVLFAKNAEQPMPPSSMSKLMTLYLLFERLAGGGLTMEDEFPVSEKAWRMGGSKMFVEIGKRVKVGDLVRGIVVQSGNDACIVVAEGIGGDETSFASLMNEKARELGLLDSHFVNASGWPDPDHVMSARDLARLAGALIDKFPQYYDLFAEKSFTFNKIRQGNRNPLLYKNIGADGLKTGHTRAAGYGLVASAVRKGRRLTLVVNGLTSVNQRSRESERLLTWGFREFGSYALFKAGEVVADAEVWLGSEASLPLLIEEPLNVIMPRRARRAMKVSVNYQGPLPAPIVKGQRVATLRIEAPNFTTVERPLIAGARIDRKGLFGRLGMALEHLLFGSVSR